MKTKKVYRARHPKIASAPARKQEASNYWRLLGFQTLVCATLLMGIMVMGRLPNNGGLEQIRRTVLSDMAFTRHNTWYERVMVNLFPFSYIPSNILPEPTVAVSGDGEGVSGQESLSATLVRNIAHGLELNYGDGIIVNTLQEENILSPVAGVVVERGTDRTNEIGEYVVIQLADNSLLTIGLMDNIRVAYLDHVLVGTPLGSGTAMEDLGEEAYFYLSVQNRDGEFMDTIEFLNQLVLDERDN